MTIKYGKMFVMDYEKLYFWEKSYPFTNKKCRILFDMGTGLLEEFSNKLSWNSVLKNINYTTPEIIFKADTPALIIDKKNINIKLYAKNIINYGLIDIKIIQEIMQTNIQSRVNSAYTINGKSFLEVLKISPDKENYIFTWDSSVLDLSDKDVQEICICIWENSGYLS